MSGRVASPTITWPDYQDMVSLESYTAVAAHTGVRELTVGHGASAARIVGTLVTGSYWEVLEVRPALGRFFTTEEDRAGAAPTVVLGHGYWRRQYGGSRSALGQTIDFGYGPYTVIGVAPKGFTGVGLNAVDVWLPLVPAGLALQGDSWQTGRGFYWISAVARLAPGVTEERAIAEASAAHRAGREAIIARGNYDAQARVLPFSIVPGRAPKKTTTEGAYVQNSARSWGTESDVALWLAGVSAVVLLIACVNVANLLLLRALRQRRETGIRLALGVSHARLIGQTTRRSGRGDWVRRCSPSSGRSRSWLLLSACTRCSASTWRSGRARSVSGRRSAPTVAPSSAWSSAAACCSPAWAS